MSSVFSRTALFALLSLLPLASGSAQQPNAWVELTNQVSGQLTNQVSSSAQPLWAPRFGGTWYAVGTRGNAVPVQFEEDGLRVGGISYPTDRQSWSAREGRRFSRGPSLRLYASGGPRGMAILADEVGGVSQVGSQLTQGTQLARKFWFPLQKAIRGSQKLAALVFGRIRQSRDQQDLFVETFWQIGGQRTSADPRMFGSAQLAKAVFWNVGVYSNREDARTVAQSLQNLQDQQQASSMSPASCRQQVRSTIETQKARLQVVRRYTAPENGDEQNRLNEFEQQLDQRVDQLLATCRQVPRR